MEEEEEEAVTIFRIVENVKCKKAGATNDPFSFSYYDILVHISMDGIGKNKLDSGDHSRDFYGLRLYSSLHFVKLFFFFLLSLSLLLTGNHKGGADDIVKHPWFNRIDFSSYLSRKVNGTYMVD